MLKESLLSKVSLKREKVSFEDIDGDFYVSEMSGSMRDSFEQALVKRDGNGNLVNARAKLVVATLVDSDGKRVFTDDDVDVVGRIPFRILDKVCSVAQRLNGLTESDIDDAKKN